MSEPMTRDLNGALRSARKTASHSVTLFKAVVGGGRPDMAPEPANETGEAPAPVRRDPSVISANTAMTGSLATEDELHIHGKIEGDVRAAMITVCAGGIVKGDLAAETIIIHGNVDGKIEGRHVLLRAGAMVKGEIAHGTLGLDTAAVFEGSVKRLPTKETPAATAAE
jgi:cytoskeletal protein CcmA (bactofilin family)